MKLFTKVTIGLKGDYYISKFKPFLSPTGQFEGLTEYYGTGIVRIFAGIKIS